MITPTPYDVVFAGFLNSVEASPIAFALSTIAQTGDKRYSAVQGRKLLFLVRTLISLPVSVRRKHSSVPSPPSAIGKTRVFAAGETSFIAFSMVSATSSAVSVPLKLSGQMRICLFSINSAVMITSI